MNFSVKEDIIQLTSQWTGERFPDGRPKVPDSHLKALHALTLEEVWKPIYVKGYINQFEGRLKLLHNDGRKMIGRAVTAAYCPTRPDLNETVMEIGRSEGRTGTYNQWVVDSLIEGDVCVIDMYDKIYKGTFLGGNLTTAVANKTKTGGGVIWGVDPTPIREFVMTGFNTPVRIGNAVCLPGDVVFGTESGILFIPAHLVQEVVDGAVKTKVKDMFGFDMITQNKFTTAQIDKNVWTEEMLDLLLEYIDTHEEAAEFRGIDWSLEYDLARNGDPNDTQSAL